MRRCACYANSASGQANWGSQRYVSKALDISIKGAAVIEGTVKFLNGAIPLCDFSAQPAVVCFAEIELALKEGDPLQQVVFGVLSHRVPLLRLPVESSAHPAREAA